MPPILPADRLERLSDAVGRKVLRLWAATDSGDIPIEFAARVIPLTVEVGNAKSQTLAQTTYLTERAEQVGAFPDGLAHRPDHGLDGRRLGESVQTILGDETLDRGVRLVRLAVNEVAEAFAQMTTALIRSDSLVEGWVREFNSTACEMCSSWWYRDGRVWPADHVMPRHTGCRCRQATVWRKRVEAVKH